MDARRVTRCWSGDERHSGNSREGFQLRVCRDGERWACGGGEVVREGQNCRTGDEGGEGGSSGLPDTRKGRLVTGEEELRDAFVG